MAYLIKTIETYRCRDEDEAKSFIDAMKENHQYEIIKHKMEKKALKAKGEIVDEWTRLEVTKIFNDEKEPYSDVVISYGSAKEMNFDEN